MREEIIKRQGEMGSEWERERGAQGMREWRRERDADQRTRDSHQTTTKFCFWERESSHQHFEREKVVLVQ